MHSRGGLLREVRARLAAAGVDNPGLDARILVRTALGVADAALVADADAGVAPGAWARALALAARRAAGEPVARILGEREFWGLPLGLSQATLVPRPDTETVVEAGLAALGAGARDQPWRLLDLGTGSGAILLALLTELPLAWGLGIDRSPEAATAAAANAVRHGLAGRAAFAAMDWTAGVCGAFDLIVANPPYIPTGDLAGLDIEVRRHDPVLALDGGPDGLAAYRAIARRAGRLLSPAGRLVFELGTGQADAVAAITTQAGFTVSFTRRDISGITRALVAQNQLGLGNSA